MAIRIALLSTALYTYHIGFCSIQIPHYHLHISSQPMNIRISFRFICAILFALSIHFWICSCSCYRLTWMVIGRGLRVVWVSFERRLSVVWANFNALLMFVFCIHRYFQSFIDDFDVFVYVSDDSDIYRGDASEIVGMGDCVTDLLWQSAHWN